MSALLKKPRKWALSPGLVAPEWAWFWKRARLVVPFWEGGGTSNFDLVKGLKFNWDTTSNVPTWKPGPSGNRVNFPTSQTEDNMVTTLNGPLNLTDPDKITLIAKVKTGAATARGTVFSPDNVANLAQMELEASRVTIIIDGVFMARSNLSVLVANTEYFITYVRFASGDSHRIYLDGVELSLFSSATNSYTEPADVDLMMGNRGQTAGSQSLDADIDYFAYLDGAISTEEVRQLAADPFGPFHMDADVSVFSVGDINTAEKRKSVSGVWLPLIPGVTPNSGKDVEWRWEAGWSYSGVATEVVAAGQPTMRRWGAIPGMDGNRSGGRFGRTW